MILLNLISLLIFSFGFSQEVEVYAIVKGVVKRVHVKEGQKVEKGQLLVEIDPSLYLSEIEKLRAQLTAQRLKLDKVEKDFKRYESLYERGLLSRSEYEDWKNKYEREEAVYQSIQSELKGLEKLVEYCNIFSPTKGVIKKLLVRENSFVNGTMNPQLLMIISEN
ncbi:efflux RND transporter periplasmic adaptor subunit [Thermocrinis sp.]